MLLSFTAMLGLRKLQRGVIGAPDAARGAVYLPPPNATTTLGYKRIQREHRASAKALW